MVHMIYLMFICIGAPLLLMLFLLEKQSRVTVGYMILGMVMCLFAGEVNALLMQHLRLNLQYAAVTLTPITEEIIKALPVLFYAFVISDKWERLLSLSMALGIGFAIMENVCVVTQNIESADVLLALIRGFATGLMHGICTATVGYGISFVRKRKKTVLHRHFRSSPSRCHLPRYFQYVGTTSLSGGRIFHAHRDLYSRRSIHNQEKN